MAVLGMMEEAKESQWKDSGAPCWGYLDVFLKHCRYTQSYSPVSIFTYKKGPKTENIPRKNVVMWGEFYNLDVGTCFKTRR